MIYNSDQISTMKERQGAIFSHMFICHLIEKTKRFSLRYKSTKYIGK
jgi:hypothetical protein